MTIHPNSKAYHGDPNFRPYALELAKAVAHRVAIMWPEKKIEYDHSKGPGCGLCEAPNRETIDRMLLTGAETKSIRKAAPTYVHYQQERFLKHRDFHLMPFIAREVKPEYQNLMEIPYPSDGDVLQKGWWYLMRTYAISQRAYHDGDTNVALNALKEMRKVDVEMVISSRSNLTDTPPNTLEIGGDTPASAFPNHDDRLNRAFARSAAPKAEVSDAPIETESSPGTE